MVLRSDSPRWQIPVRGGPAVEREICRVDVLADAMLATLDVDLDLDRSTPVWRVIAGPDVSISGLKIKTLGSCSLSLDLEGAVGEVEDYLLEAVTKAIVAHVEVSPLSLSGIQIDTRELAVRSGFENRRGRLFLRRALPESDGVVLVEGGLRATIDVGVGADRAACAPPTPIESTATAGAQEPDLETLAGFSADLAVAFSQSLLERFWQAATLAGLVCQGLDSLWPSQTLRTEDLLLEEIGILDSSLGAESRFVSIPGALPQIRQEPENNEMRLTWANLSLDLYTDYLGVPVRVLRLTSSMTARLRPETSSQGVLHLGIQSLQVSDVLVVSPWIEQNPVEEVLRRWARRTMLVALSDQFQFPLPFEDGADLRLVGAEVRAQDLVLYLIVDVGDQAP
jgi:hypothetical protein